MSPTAYDDWLGRTRTVRSVRSAGRPRTRGRGAAGLALVAGLALRILVAMVAAVAAMIALATEAGAAPRTPADSESVVNPAYTQGLTLAAMIAFCSLGLTVAALIIAGLRRANRRAAEERALDEQPAPAPYRGEVARLFDVDLAAARRQRRLAAEREATTRRAQESAWSGPSW